MMESEPLDLAVEIQKKAIEKAAEDFPILGPFSPEQYSRAEGGMGSVYIPQHRRWSKFTNLKSKHLKARYRALYMIEVAAATREKRPIDTAKIVANNDTDLGDINGWRSGQYIRTSPLGPLGPPPMAKPGFWERRRLKKQGGW